MQVKVNPDSGQVTTSLSAADLSIGGRRTETFDEYADRLTQTNLRKSWVKTSRERINRISNTPTRATSGLSIALPVELPGADDALEFIEVEFRVIGEDEGLAAVAVEFAVRGDVDDLEGLVFDAGTEIAFQEGAVEEDRRLGGDAIFDGGGLTEHGLQGGESANAFAEGANEHEGFAPGNLVRLH